MIDTSKHDLYWGWENKLIFTGGEANQPYSIIINDYDTLHMIDHSISIPPKYNAKSYNKNTISVIDHNNNIIFKQQFNCKRIPDAQIVIGDQVKKKYTIQDLINHQSLRIVVPNNNLKDLNYAIHSYKINIQNGDHEYSMYDIKPKGSIDTIPVQHPVSGEMLYTIVTNETEVKQERFLNNPLNVPTMEQLKSLPKNAVMNINEIEIVGPDKITRRTDAITLRMK